MRGRLADCALPIKSNAIASPRGTPLAFTAQSLWSTGHFAMKAFRPQLSLTVFWLLLVLLAGGRGLVPSGWMPVAQGDEIAIALCGSGGSVAIALNNNGDSDPATDSGTADDNAHQTCPYAVAAHAANLPPVPVIAAEPLVAAADWHAPFTAFALTRAYAPRPPTRGPPHTV